MVRPRSAHPTPAELEILKVIWDRGPSTVREVMDALSEQSPRAYTTVMTTLNVMTEKGLLERTQEGRAFVYGARATKADTLSAMLGDLLTRAFDGSASALVIQLLDRADITRDELTQIRRTIDAHRDKGDT